MSEIFKAGDRVHHIGRQENGTILPFNLTGVVRVEFDSLTPRLNPSIGEFDAIWFKSHPNWLQLIPQQAPGA